MSNIGTCGHKIDDLGTTLNIKDYDSANNRIVSSVTICSDCIITYKKENKIIENIADEEKWLGINTHNEEQKPFLLMKVVSFKRKKSSDYEKGWYFESNSKDTNQQIVDINGHIVKKVYDILDNCLTQIELSKLL